jgi:nuclear transport factor 2 (NTF2) superfamily protein
MFFQYKQLAPVSEYSLPVFERSAAISRADDGRRRLYRPFTLETARQKVRMAEDAWNSRDPGGVVLAYTRDSRWRNPTELLQGREAIHAFLVRKWERELGYRLIKEIWGCRENRIAVRFAYEWHDAENQWYRSYGNENWEFDEQGLVRLASINDAPITRNERRYHWPVGRRPDHHPSLSDLVF